MITSKLHTYRLLLAREFRLFWSNKVFVAAFLIMPVILSSVQGFVYQRGKVKQQSIIVVDLDQSPASHKFRDMLEDDPVLNVVAVHYETPRLQQILLDNRAIAVVEIPYRFEAQLLTQKKPEINCYLNMANTLSSGAVGGAISLCAATMNVGIITSALSKKGTPASIAAQEYEAFKSNVFYQYNRGGNYLYFLWPGLIFSTLHQLLLLALAVSFSREFYDGTFTQAGLLSYSKSPFVLELAKVIPFILMSLYTVSVYYLLSYYFRVPLPAHPFVLLVAQVLLAIGASCLGTFYSIIYPLPLKASQLLMSLASPAFTLSGFTWPSEQAPAFLVSLGKIIPLSPYMHILRMVLLERADWHDVHPHLLHQLILAVIYFTLSIVLLYRKILKSKSLSGSHPNLVVQ